MEVIFKLGDISTVAKEFVANLGDRKVVAFHGNMGTGKTTFIHEICAESGVTENISSPTFSIIHEYVGAKGKIYHIDLYRLKDEQEAVEAGVEDCVYSGDYCFIEWPEKIASLLPDRVLDVYIEMIDEETRKLIYSI